MLIEDLLRMATVIVAWLQILRSNHMDKTCDAFNCLSWTSCPSVHIVSDVYVQYSGSWIA